MITDRTLYAYEQFCEEYLNYSELNLLSDNNIMDRYCRKDLPTFSEVDKPKMKRNPKYRPISLHDKWAIDNQQLALLARMMANPKDREKINRNIKHLARQLDDTNK